MVIGASTSNLYPALTEDALDTLLQLGFREVEVFLNTESETETGYVRQLRKKADLAGARIRSVHPYISGSEPYLLFSAYERRFQDGLHLYEELFAAAKELGAELVVMHGDKLHGVLPVEESVGRFERVYELGKGYGVTLLQENVNRFRSSDVDYIRAMRAQLGEKAHFVLDLKQCRRYGADPLKVADAMGENLVHVHVSDQDDEHDCLIPGRGTNDFAGLFRHLKAMGFDGAVMLELYRQNFSDPEELVEGRRYLEKVLGELSV